MSSRRLPVLEKLVDLAPDSILVVDQDGLITDVNARTEQMFGFARAELVGQAVEVLIPERFRKEHPAHRHSYASKPNVRPMGVGLPLLGRRKDGTEFPVDIMLSPVETATEPLVLAVIRDVTEQRQAQEALQRTEQQLRMIVENVRDHAIFLLDVDGNVRTWNAGAERIKGYTAAEIIGQHFSRFYPSEALERNKPQEELRIAAEQGRYEEEGWRVRKDGSRLWASVVITALHDRSGKLVGFAKVTRDFSDRKRAEDALQVHLSSVLISNLDLSKLLAAASEAIEEVVPHDAAELAIHDSDANVLRAHWLDRNGKPEVESDETVLRLSDSAAGDAFTQAAPLLFSELPDGRLAAETSNKLAAHKIQSAVWIPLTYHERAVGTLMIASKTRGAMTQATVETLVRISSQIAAAVENALAFRAMARTNERLTLEKSYLEDELTSENNFEEIVGESSGLKRVLKQVETVSPTDATVLILGETGTGKELIARAIHRLSKRRDRTFVKLNCAAIPSGLLESELFGHEKGAFTGAISQKVGRLELAHNGTLFLDEVGDIPLELQPKLLRALQEKEFERLGSTRTLNVDVRLVAATNRNLGQMVADGEFRSDLYYRLKVFPVELPPLRDREDDIPLLVRYFVDKHARKLGKSIQTISPEAMAAFLRWQWPGNIRELENFLERAVILSTGPNLHVPLAELAFTDAQPVPAADTSLASAEREHILQVLRETKGVIAGASGAAARLGLKRTTLNAKLKKLGIQRKDYS